MFRLTALLLLLFLWVAPAAAQTLTPDGKSLPIAVAMLYEKLLGREPDFAALVTRYSSEDSQKPGFGQEALVKQRILALREIYESLNDQTVLPGQALWRIEGVNESEQSARLTLTPETHFAFTPFPDETYGVFIHNLDEVRDLKPPYLHYGIKDIAKVAKRDGASVEAYVLLRPIAADPEDFILEDGASVKVLLAEIVEVKLFFPGRQTPFLHKRFNDWRPATEDTLLDPEMRQALEEKMAR